MAEAYSHTYELDFPHSFPLIVKQKLEQWIKDSKRVSIFVVGKTGTGKSTLVNGLIGRDVAKQGHTLQAETSIVQKHTVKFGNILVEAWDTPGLQDETGDETVYVQCIRDHAINKDLYLFCISMANTRLVQDSPEIKTMQIMTEELGEHFWDNTVIVLTFANRVVACGRYKVRDKSEEAMQEYFAEQLSLWTETLRSYLKESVKLSDDLVQRIKIIPTGTTSMPKLPDPDGANWMSKLFIESLSVTKSRAQPALIRLNAHRLVTNVTDTKDELYIKDRLLYEQPLILAKRGQEYGALYDSSTAEQGWVFGVTKGVTQGLGLCVLVGFKNAIFNSDDIV